MLDRFTKEPEEGLAGQAAPHLSHSRVNRYLHCPEQYRLYYLERLRPQRPPASLVFGNILHQALAELLGRRADPVQCFATLWTHLEHADLDYGDRSSWAKLKSCGEALLERFAREEVSRLGAIRAVEKGFELTITSLDLPLIGVIDLVAELEDKLTVVDFKTSASAYGAHEVALADQLSAYRLAEPEAVQVSLCVLVKTKEPRIEWHLAERGPEQLAEYLAKLGYVAQELSSGRFYKRPGFWCAWCDYLPVCAGQGQVVRQRLVQIPAAAPQAREVTHE